MINKFLYTKGGAENYMLKLGRYLTSLGHEVQYFGMDDEKRCVGNDIDAYTRAMDFHGGWNFDKLTYMVSSLIFLRFFRGGVYSSRGSTVITSLVLLLVCSSFSSTLLARSSTSSGTPASLATWMP